MKRLQLGTHHSLSTGDVSFDHFICRCRFVIFFFICVSWKFDLTRREHQRAIYTRKIKTSWKWLFTKTSPRPRAHASRWRHTMETFSALLALCSGNSPVTGEFPSQRPVTRSFDDFFDLRLNNHLSKQSRRSWLRRHRAHYDVIVMKKFCSPV